MPGVVTTTAVRSGPAAAAVDPAGSFFIVGMAERGGTASPVRIRSLSEYSNLFGDRVAYGFLYDQLQTFFAEGGGQAYVVRAVGSAATKGFLSLSDTASGSPLPTVKFEAASEGAWSTQLSVKVETGTVASSVKITLSFNGVVVQAEDNLTSPAMIVQRFSNSPYVNVTDLGSATVAPGNNPAVLSDTPLSAGSDDRASVTAATLGTALGLFDPDLGDGAVAIPGYGSTVHAAIKAHCESTNRRIGLLVTDVDDAEADILAYPNTLDSEFVAIWANRCVIPDGSGGTRVITPEGFLAAKRAKAIQQAGGPWRAFAGDIAIANFVVGIDVSYTSAKIDQYSAARVNVLRSLAGSVRNYGVRSTSLDETNYSLIGHRDMMNRIVVAGEQRLEPFVFRSIDAKGQLFADVHNALIAMLEPYRAEGGLFEGRDADGNLVDPGYSVDTSGVVNTTTMLAANTIAAVIQVRISPTGAKLSLTILKVGLTDSL
jgi:hypothetical protein